MRKKVEASLRIIALLSMLQYGLQMQARRAVFLFGNRVIRACVDADVALDASVLVDNADVLDLQCVLRAFALADAASDAIFRLDFHCHGKPQSLLARCAFSTQHSRTMSCIDGASNITTDA